MIDFDEVIQRIKHILRLQLEKDKVLDKDIANALKLNSQYFAVIKRRNKIPYEAISYFCKQYKISINWILLAQKPEYLT